MGKIFGLKSDQVHDFILKGQEKDPKEDQVSWKVKYLSVAIAAEISDSIYSAKGFGKKREELLKAGTQQLEILRRGLVGWENFKYEDETLVEWEDPPRGGTVTKFYEAMDKNLNKVPPEIRDEIADHIRGGSVAELD